MPVFDAPGALPHFHHVIWGLGSGGIGWDIVEKSGMRRGQYSQSIRGRTSKITEVQSILWCYCRHGHAVVENITYYKGNR